MKVTGKRTVFEGQYLRVVEKAVDSGDGTDRAWETVERTNVHGSGAVVIIALTKDGDLVFEKNWRAGTESCVIQFPAGLTDLEGETEEEAARRELLEETGYAATELIPVFLSPLSAALTGTRAMHFFAPDVEFVGKPAGKDIEEIEVLKVPVDEADEFMLGLPEGVELDLRVPGILWLLRKKGLI
jgi:ADP-ribose pyrophosphatase